MNDKIEDYDILGLKKDGYTPEQIQSMMLKDEDQEKKEQEAEIKVKTEEEQPKKFIPGENLSPSQVKIVEMILLVEEMHDDYNKSTGRLASHLSLFKKCLAREYIWFDIKIKDEWNKRLTEENMDKKYKLKTNVRINRYFVEEKVKKWYVTWKHYNKRADDPRFDMLIAFLKERYFNMKRNQSTNSYPGSESTIQ